MGKSLSRHERKDNKFIRRGVEQKLKEQQRYSSIKSEPKEKPKQKWRPRSEDVD